VRRKRVLSQQPARKKGLAVVEGDMPQIQQDVFDILQWLIAQSCPGELFANAFVIVAQNELAHPKRGMKGHARIRKIREHDEVKGRTFPDFPSARLSVELRVSRFEQLSIFLGATIGPPVVSTSRIQECPAVVECNLTTQLSGRPRPPLRAAEHAIHCEDGAATMNHGPLKRVVSSHMRPFQYCGRRRWWAIATTTICSDSTA